MDFFWPGLGLLTFNAILTRDYPLILGSTTFSAALVILANFAALAGETDAAAAAR